MKIKRLKDGRYSVTLPPNVWCMIAEALSHQHLALLKDNALPLWADRFISDTIEKVKDGGGFRHFKESEFYLVFSWGVLQYLPPGMPEVLEQNILEPLRKSNQIGA